MLQVETAQRPWQEELARSAAEPALREALLQGRWSEVQEQAERIRAHRGDSLPLLEVVAVVQAIQGQVRRAVETRLSMTRLLMGLHQWEAALDQVGRALSLSPRGVSGRRLQLEILARLGRSQDVTRLARELSHLQLEQGEGDAAIALLRELRAQLPHSLELQHELAEAYLTQGHLMDARRELRAVVDRYLQDGRLEEAGPVLRRLRILAPDCLDLSLELGSLLRQTGRYQEAEKEFRGVLRSDLNHLEALTQLGEICFLSGQFRDALLVYRRLVSLVPDDVTLLERTAEVYASQGLTADAVAYFESAARAWLQHGSSVSKAWVCVHKILRLDPEHRPARELSLQCQALSVDPLPMVDVQPWGPVQQPVLPEGESIPVRPNLVGAQETSVDSPSGETPRWGLKRRPTPPKAGHKPAITASPGGLVRKTAPERRISDKPRLLPSRPPASDAEPPVAPAEVSPLEPVASSEPVPAEWIIDPPLAGEEQDWALFPLTEEQAEVPDWLAQGDAPIDPADQPQEPQAPVATEDNAPATPEPLELPGHFQGIDFPHEQLLAVGERLRHFAQSPELATAQAQIDELQALVAEDPSHMALRYQLAHTYLNWGQPQSAQAHLSYLVAQRPLCLRLRLQLFEAHLWQADYDAATCTLVEAASILSQDNHNSSAVEALQLALSLEPTHALASLKLVDFLQRLGSPALAQCHLHRLAGDVRVDAKLRVEAMRRLLQTTGSRRDHFCLIELLRDQRRTAEALEELESLWTRCADDPTWGGLVCETALEMESSAWLSWAERKWALRGQLTQFAHLPQAQARTAQFALRWVEQLWRQARPAEALQKLDNLQPHLAASAEVVAHLRLLCLIDLGRTEEAHAAYLQWSPTAHPLARDIQRRIVKLWPVDPKVAHDTYLTLGSEEVAAFAQVQLEAGRTELAYQLLDRLAQDKGQADIHWKLAHLARHLESPDQEKEQLQRLVKVRPEHWEANLRLAQLDCAEGRGSEAAERLSRLLQSQLQRRPALLEQLVAQADELLQSQSLDASGWHILALAEVLRGLGEPEKALHLCRQLRRCPRWACLSQARAALSLADSRDPVFCATALRQVERTLADQAVNPEDVRELAFARGVLLRALNRENEAQACFEQCRSLGLQG